MQEQKVATWIAILLAFGAGAYLIWSVGLQSSPDLPLVEENDIQNEKLIYSSEELGLVFQYPKNYRLQEETVSSAQRLHKRIVLIEESQINSRENIAPTEGPTSITVDVFQNNLDNQTAMDFITGNNNSNYKLGSGEIESGTLSGLEAHRYVWDGLYRGESIATANDKFVYMFSATSLEESDPIRSDFYELINSVEIN